MSKVYKTFGGLAILNLFFIAPLLVVLTANVPRIARVEVLAKTAVAIKIGEVNGDAPPSWERVKACSGAIVPQSITINLPCGFPVDKFCVSVDNANLERVFLRKNFLLGRWYDCRKKGEVWICNGRVPFLPCLPLVVWCAIALFETVLLGLLFAFSKKHESKKEPQRGMFFSAAVAALASGFFAIAIPLQTFVANRALFKFSTGEFVLQTFLVWLVAFLVLWVGLMLSRRTFGYFLHGLVLAVVCYEYLQTGIFSIGEPSINGEVTYYMSKSLKVRDSLVLATVFAIFIIGYHWLKPYMKWIALGLAIMIGASLLDIKKDTHNQAISSPLSPGFCSKFEVARNLVHSGRRNVMMLILDSVSTEVSLDVLAERPIFRDVFSGFVAFTNNIGVHNFTESSIPAIMTGKLFDHGIEDGCEFQDYGFSALGDKSFLNDYRAAGIPASFLPGSFMFGYSSGMESERNTKDEASWKGGSIFDYRPDTTPPLTLFETMRFRLAPFALKYKVLLTTFVGTKSHSSVKGEAALYPMLADAPIDVSLPNNLEIFHTQGAHAPFDVDRNGCILPSVRIDYAGHLDKAICAFSQLAHLMSAYKGRGIYDKSFIVVAADHGWMSKNHIANPHALDCRAPTMLWVKPIGAQGPLTFCEESTYHLNLKALMVSVMTNDLSMIEVKKALHSENRVYRRLDRHGYDEWHVDTLGNAIKK